MEERPGAELVSACYEKGMSLNTGTEVSLSIAMQGGALAASLCDVYLDGVALNSNRAEATGGSVELLKGATITVRGETRFYNNSAKKKGGAVSCVECESIELRNGTTFWRNHAGTRGGAVAVEAALADDDGMMMDSHGSMFVRNTAGMDGGAVAVSFESNERVAVWRSTSDEFSNNTADTGAGGAIYAVGTRVEMWNGTICSGNKALRGGGGGIMWEPRAPNVASPRWSECDPFRDENSRVNINEAEYGDNLATQTKTLRIMSAGDGKFRVRAADQRFVEAPRVVALAH